MAGRNKQPLSVILGKGKAKHLTKAVIAERQKQEDTIKGDTDKVSPPKRLLAKQKEEFDIIANELMKLEIFSNLDVDTLTRYIDAKSEYERIVDIVRKIKPLDDVDIYTKLQRAKKSLSDECRAYAADLGLTITSRLKLVIPQKEKTEESEFDRKFGDL
ncbi:phage terminase small subunit P27 family [Sporosarcina sp. E16_8]|uniref:phage terminase small subunit P27 family n=1 Tax=Sporosarcina sp. E16_8 TaxID=2789295 RepID=UPI001A911BD6|nr:phage terminase small subunit P27 family [Sporosarcina sp. E16_8]MBO0586126.1 phage terminase small subunit P27 family [Sporosarcina sp. E16_8]